MRKRMQEVKAKKVSLIINLVTDSWTIHAKFVNRKEMEEMKA